MKFKVGAAAVCTENSEANRVRKKHNRAIIAADVRRFVTRSNGRSFRHTHLAEIDACPCRKLDLDRNGGAIHLPLMIEFIVHLARCDDFTSRRESRPDQIFGKDRAATRLWDTSNDSTISNMSAISQSRVVTPAAIAGVMREFSTDDYLVVTCKSDIVDR